MGAYRDELDDEVERHESMRDREYLDERRRDRLDDYAPAPDFPRTLGERHDENLAAIDQGLERAEHLADECHDRVQRLLGGEPA
jgi:hypothetical protein